MQYVDINLDDYDESMSLADILRQAILEAEDADFVMEVTCAGCQQTCDYEESAFYPGQDDNILFTCINCTRAIEAGELDPATLRAPGGFSDDEAEGSTETLAPESA